MASGGLAGGLAEGFQNALQLHMQNKYYNGLNDARATANDLREQALEARIAKANGTGQASTKGGDYEGFDAALVPIFNSGGNKPNAGQAVPAQAQIAGAGLGTGSPTTLPNAGLLAQNPEAAYQSGGIAQVAPQQPPQAAAPEQQAEQISPRQQIVKDMMFGDLANQPDKLNAIAAAAALHGLGDKITPWIEGLYKAKKSGVFDGAMSLMNNNVDGAIEQLKRGGIQLEDRPEKVNPDDPNDHRWKINIRGTGERVMDIKNMIASTMDADKFMDLQNKTKVANAQAESHTANAEESRAKAKLYSAGGLSAASRGKGGGASSGPTVRKTVETDQGIVAVMSDGTKRIIADDQGQPMFGTSNQKIAAGLVGKTLDPFSENTDIAQRVNTVAGQLRGRNTQTAPARINELPAGAKMIGTSKGKPVYEVNGKRFIPE